MKNVLSDFSIKLHVLNFYQNKLNNFFGLIISGIMIKSVLWMIFTPLTFNYKLDISFLSIIIHISSPLTLLIVCCIIPEIVLRKVSLVLYSKYKL